MSKLPESCPADQPARAEHPVPPDWHSLPEQIRICNRSSQYWLYDKRGRLLFVALGKGLAPNLAGGSGDRPEAAAVKLEIDRLQADGKRVDDLRVEPGAGVGDDSEQRLGR